MFDRCERAEREREWDRERAIARWRERLAETGHFFERDLDELEEHVHDHLDALEEVGLAGEAAFRIALESLGETGALGDEFAKVNRLLAWRAPLFWIGSGALAVLLGVSALRIVATALVFTEAALRFPALAIRGTMWAVTLGLPLALFGALVRWTRARRGRAPLAWAASPARRVSVVVACAAITLVGMLTQYSSSWSGLLDSPHDALDEGINAMWSANAALGYAAPITLVAFVFGVRLAGSDPNHRSPLAWLTLGCLIAFGGEEATFVARFASLAGSAAVHADASALRAVTWIVTLATPAVVIATGAAWLARRSPPPDAFLRGRAYVAATLALCALPILSPMASAPLSAHAAKTFAAGMMIEGFRADFQARLVVISLVVVAVGALVLRLRDAGAKLGSAR